jgi:hypothetical protein
MKLNIELSELIQELLILGYTIPDLADNWGVSKTNLTSKYNVVKNKNKYINKFEIKGKIEPYYKNEWHYGFIPTYSFEELSKKEIEFYYDNLKKNN